MKPQAFQTMRDKMTRNNTVNVNGQDYDKSTGMPISDMKPARTVASELKARQQATTLHDSTQKSKTLRRSSTPKPKTQPKKEAASQLATKRPQRRMFDIARHPSVKKIAATTSTTSVDQPDLSPRSHPHVEKANQKVATKKLATKSVRRKTMTPKEKKEAEIAKALTAPAKKEKTPKVVKPKKQRSRRRKKITKVSAIIISIVIILGVVLWINLPILSVRLASAQTGVSATIPNFIPEGFRLQWPAKSEDNKVSIKFSAVNSDNSFSLHQSNSSWNSDAVRDMIESRSNGRFLTSRDRGITVYTYDGNAAWVNKGILYTIDGNVQLSNDDIMRIANSL